jgi:hypothetical protein
MGYDSDLLFIDLVTTEIRGPKMLQTVELDVLREIGSGVVNREVLVVVAEVDLPSLGLNLLDFIFRQRILRKSTDVDQLLDVPFVL